MAVLNKWYVGETGAREMHNQDPHLAGRTIPGYYEQRTGSGQGGYL
jgi:hypothetical protein